MRKDHPHTPDGRYFVARGVLRRCTNPDLPDKTRRPLIKTLMQARMAMRSATTADEQVAIRGLIENAKSALGEAGPVWWSDGTDDLSGQHPQDTDYKTWWISLPNETRRLAEVDRRQSD